MKDVTSWPVGDREWVARYRMSMIGKHVLALALQERERELLGTVRELELSAEVLFGGAEELASEDAAELATVDEAVRTSLGGGLQPALREVGGMLVGIGAATSLILIIRSDWFFDVDSAPIMVAASVLVVFVGWVASRMPRHELGENWNDVQWLRRFRGGLRARLMPAATARGHIAEIEQTLAGGGMSAYPEFGPLWSLLTK